MSDSTRSFLYKNNDKDFESLRKQRQDHSVEIRKNKKIDNLQKRRNIQIDDNDDNVDEENINPRFTVEMLCKNMKSANMTVKVEAVCEARKLLSVKENPPIDEFYENGAVKILVDIMKENNDKTLVFEAAWALTNIASGESEFTQAVVNAGGISLFISFFGHGSDNISEQCIWALSNIVGDCAEYRDQTFKHGIITEIGAAVERFWNQEEILKNVAWLISNLCRHKTANYPVKEVRQLLPLMGHMIAEKSTSMSLVSDLCWGLSYAVDSDSDIVDEVIRLGLQKVVMPLLSREAAVAAPALRLVGNIVSGTNEQADAAINAGAVEAVSALLDSGVEPRIAKECCWLLSNVSAGSDSQIQRLLNSGVMEKVLRVLHSGDYRAQKEAVWVVCNMTTNKEDGPKLYLLNNGIFTAMMPVLTCGDTEIIKLLLDCVRDLFTTADKFSQLDKCIELFEEAGGVDAVEKLQEHESEVIYEKCYRLVSDFMGVDDVEEAAPAEGAASTEEHKNQFQF